MRKRKIRKYGNSYYISVTHIDMKDFELQEGDEVDIEDLLILNSQKRKRRKTKN